VISAIAIDQGAVVATGNTRHFEEINTHIPFPGIYNPFKDAWAVSPRMPTTDAP
jgi:hypothetical protein